MIFLNCFQMVINLLINCHNNKKIKTLTDTTELVKAEAMLLLLVLQLLLLLLLFCRYYCISVSFTVVVVLLLLLCILFFLIFLLLLLMLLMLLLLFLLLPFCAWNFKSSNHNFKMVNSRTVILDKHKNAFEPFLRQIFPHSHRLNMQSTALRWKRTLASCKSSWNGIKPERGRNWHRTRVEDW